MNTGKRKSWIARFTEYLALGVLAISVAGCVIDPYPPPPSVAVAPGYYGGPYSYYDYPPYYGGPSFGFIYDNGGGYYHHHRWH